MAVKQKTSLKAADGLKRECERPNSSPPSSNPEMQIWQYREENQTAWHNAKGRGVETLIESVRMRD